MGGFFLSRKLGTFPNFEEENLTLMRAYSFIVNAKNGGIATARNRNRWLCKSTLMYSRLGHDSNRVGDYMYVVVGYLFVIFVCVFGSVTAEIRFE